jgi:hypothetical protein
MTTCHDVQPRLSEIADGTLDAAERATIDAHLARCSACRGILEDLQRLRRAAAALGPIDPPDHVWLEVAGQTRGHRGVAASAPARARRAAFVQWAGLAAALVAITLGAHFFLTSVPSDADRVTTSNAPATGDVEVIARELTLAMEHYDKAIVELEALARSNSDVLDTQMAETLRQNIQTVNAAIDESRAALAQNPGSAPARESLFEALRRKVVVLQATVNLMNEMRKGNQSGAVEAAAAFGKKS